MRGFTGWLRAPLVLQLAALATALVVPGLQLFIVAFFALHAHTLHGPSRPRGRRSRRRFAGNAPTRRHPAPPPPAPARDPLEVALERIRENPLDGDAHFDLGVELLQAGDLESALPHLDRSFRLMPVTILKLLGDPTYAPVLENPSVRDLLGRYHREQQRKLWAGYA